jgi:methionyl-tRNA synthetase
MSLFMTVEKIYYITTPIYYVNDIPHIGHAYTTLACDVLARFKRMDGYHVRFLTGTDEHGQKVEKAALNAHQSPQKFVDMVSQNFRELTSVLNFSNDDFIRTTEERHKKAVIHLWQTLVDRGEIYLGNYSGWYAVRDEAFYAEAELVNGKAPTGADVEWVTEPSYFFKLSKWQDKLLQFYQDNPDFIAPESRRNEVLRFVEGGLSDLSISRTSFRWGIPVPGDENHVIYVWLDALTNYIAAIGYPETTQEFKDFWSYSLHIVGKDILRFHTVYWPAFLMAAGLTPPKRVFAHGWWTNNGEKISKSLGNSIDPLQLVKKFGVDPVRYFLMREVSFGQDGDYSDQALIGRLNSDLANNYGNLSQRVLSFIAKQTGGVIPHPGQFTQEDRKIINTGQELLEHLRHHIDYQAIHKYCEAIWRYIAEANKYIDEQKPWSLKTSDPERMETILYVLADTIRQIALFTLPIMPESSGKMLKQLAIEEDEWNFESLTQRLIPGTELPPPYGVFPRWVED